MEQYLTKDLGVPPNRIQLLLGSKEHTSPGDLMYPSRAHIIDALLSIIDNPEILYGDNIIIYYSGHGSYYLSEEQGDETEYIEALCPSIAISLATMANLSLTSATESSTPS